VTKETSSEGPQNYVTNLKVEISPFVRIFAGFSREREREKERRRGGEGERERVTQREREREEAKRTIKSQYEASEPVKYLRKFTQQGLCLPQYSHQ
jgi:hypothetical protein